MKIKIFTVVCLSGIFLMAHSGSLSAQVTRVSISSAGAEGNGNSYWPVTSSDGRFVAFNSAASNLVVGDTNNYEDIFVHDRQTGETTRVSIASDGTQQNASSGGIPSISDDGRLVAFPSWASSLVAGDTNNRLDIFVHDRQTGTTTRINVSPDGTQSNTNVTCSSISADGRYVAFSSRGNLTVGLDPELWYVFVHDRQTGEITPVPPLPSNGARSNSDLVACVLSADGRHVLFASDTNNLVVGDTNNVAGVFIHDRETTETARVSVASDGTEGNAFSLPAWMSDDARYIGFYSWASNFVAGDTSLMDVFVHDRQTGETAHVYGPGTGEPEWFRLSGDGRYFVFDSEASTLVPGDTNDSTDIFLVENPIFSSPSPDLAIQSVRIEGSRTASQIRLVITIANEGGEAAAGPFWIGSRPNWYTKPGFNSTYRVLATGETLGAGATIEKTIRVPRGDSCELMVDHNNRVEESNENNNRFTFTR